MWQNKLTLFNTFFTIVLLFSSSFSSSYFFTSGCRSFHLVLFIIVKTDSECWFFFVTYWLYDFNLVLEYAFWLKVFDKRKMFQMMQAIAIFGVNSRTVQRMATDAYQKHVGTMCIDPRLASCLNFAVGSNLGLNMSNNKPNRITLENFVRVHRSHHRYVYWLY